ncbi:RnfABCDGE type electron transport complex subunit G [Pseudothauera rhizosphaerae]|uniref:Ion-translocating oxidoreductase complex subunit G n=1 Tax=Pseudothauera rhizosphaerae TaxID=2565932 RepID=A0A4S4AS71_9RHOO|nr:RnfABCDGE type electron transport complex subunit G [Pseudothauera rhizosphaerae]THF62655.1 RnfABCDGE type electron transport complex subunit G [Pseudothauera rhizosphaerae]
MIARYTAARTSLRTALIMLVFTLLFTAAMAFTYGLTRPAIEASELAEKMRLINEVLPPGSYDNALLEDVLRLGPTPELGLAQGGALYRARKAGEPAALVLEAEAPDGYAGRIKLVLAVTADGRVSGVRVTSHKETPGLGDYIDPKKDRNKERPWITQFTGAGHDRVDAAAWKVRRDGGVFDAPTGATISARAVTNATGRALGWALARRDALFAAAPGSTLDTGKE